MAFLLAKGFIGALTFCMFGFSSVSREVVWSAEVLSFFDQNPQVLDLDRVATK